SVQNHDSDPIVLTFNQPILLTDKTVSAWIKPSATSPANSGMVVELTCSAACGAGAAGQFGLKMYVDASMSTSYYDQVYVGDGNIPFDIYSVHIPVNQWTLITISYNASTYTYLLFIDGVQQTNLLSGPGPTVHTLPYGGLVNTITIGDEYAPGYPFYGNVYNVAVYNKPLF
ncbi:MAG: hypothetical protein KGI59_02935, partial [Patescibacteria group bacterium]|nr:hypothetical protein [Patescibacteria group bacterium]